ncbi:hypothetical protein [Klebsiella pneumoniae IS43]|uniref:Uncharacterized protein n=1 Tax=Klebsiella pneumoniae IS43 TaxID=1432552 RepID=W1DJ90_KLEPN|nr:hypothetical protein [Klebsiella pneumoniae IS43]
MCIKIRKNAQFKNFNPLFLIDKNNYFVGAIVGHTIPYVSVG